MAWNQDIGRKGESLAGEILKKKGYTILQTNWRYGRAEIDIIASIKSTLVFIEVKTRSGDSFGPPEAFVSEKKERLMADAAHVYMDKYDHQGEIRFDIMSVLIKAYEPPQISHFEDAFFPGLE